MYTCSASESGRPNSTNRDSFNVTVVGEFVVYIISFAFHSLHHAGAGLFAYSSMSRRGPIDNNGLVIISETLNCMSNSSQSGVGAITAPNGTTLFPDIFLIVNPFNRPGAVRLRTVSSPITSTEQGIYTCTIPDSNSQNISLNVGVYPPGFNGELWNAL